MPQPDPPEPERRWQSHHRPDGVVPAHLGQLFYLRELRSQASYVYGFIELARSVPDPARQAEYLETAYQYATRLLCELDEASPEWPPS